ncbi:MAG: type II toxin-antitoxin system VapC family toxin [Chloroflexi bacterium]|nr:type II toxin-antitoxin system VapC family toxin [Chloroflexota bacterium]
MRLLLDTHALVWWLEGSPRLSVGAGRAIADPLNEKLVSAASAWEITTKHRLGKLPGADEFAGEIPWAIADEGFAELPITVDEAARAGGLPGPLGDPFDRMLIAQALSRNLTVVSVDSVFDGYGVRRLW